MSVIIFPWIKKERKEKYFLATEIGSESVRTILFKKNKNICVLKKSFQSFPNFSLFDLLTFKKNIIRDTILKTVQEVCQNINNKNNIPILVGLPVNILKARIISQNLKRENYKNKIDKKEELEIHQLIFKKTKDALYQNFLKSIGILSEDIEILNHKILEIKIDGYEVPKIEGFKGKDLLFKTIVIFGLKFYIEEFKRIFNEINFKNLFFIHPVQNIISAIKEDFFNGIFLNIERYFTQIFIIKNGRLFQIAEFDIGGENFSQILSQTLGISERDADILKEKYCQRKLSEGVRNRIKEIFNYVATEWFRNLKEKLNEILNISLPLNIFLFGEECQLPEFQEIFEKYWEDFSFPSQPNMKMLYPKDLKNFEDLTNTLNGPQIISLLLICYYG